MSQLPTISIIVPTYKEAENLPLLIPQVATALAPRGWVWELIVVDDNSPDATPAVLEDLSRRFPQVRSLIRTKERGLSSAVLAGIELARNDYILVMDADLSHPPEAIPAIIEKFTRNEADFVIGSRYVPGGRTEDWSALRWLNSYGATLMAKPLVGSVRDPMAGFFAMRRDMLNGTDGLNPIGYKIALELMVKMGVRPDRVAEVPILFRNRIHGESKLTVKEQFRYLEHLSRLYDYRYPKASARTKFLVAAACGTLACAATLALMDHADLPSLLSLAAGLAAMIAVTLAFFARYVHTQRDFLVMQNPYSEFAAISMAEFITGLSFAVATQAGIYTQMALGLVILLLVRYTLRKVFLHDLRGIRGTPREHATLRLTLAPRTQSAASA